MTARSTVRESKRERQKETGGDTGKTLLEEEPCGTSVAGGVWDSHLHLVLFISGVAAAAVRDAHHCGIGNDELGSACAHAQPPP